ncbi:uncharacterized protein LOC119769944 isoform X2 [Culex quinquefasciatus]|uniref:uncharacterized protein LOC119769944 isoform X2 n=1 Tax=Culex quinquefasciatus TaxID=7176 RepID=UPI0018E3EEF1|nr:uncharacterized protein LOC119769944 isoform X2 [Culex quinquefasciatus]
MFPNRRDGGLDGVFDGSIRLFHPPKQATNKKKHSLELLHCCCCWRELSTGDELHGKADVLSLPSARSSSSNGIRRRIEHQRTTTGSPGERNRQNSFCSLAANGICEDSRGGFVDEGGKTGQSKTLHQKQQQNSGGKLGKLDASFFLDGNDDDCNEEEK